MRSMAAKASLRLHRGMLVNERPARLRMAFGADCILIGRGFQVVVSKGAVRIVAVRTLHKAFIDPVVEGHIEGGLDIRVALETKGWLFGLEQNSFGNSLMHGVATDAAYIGLSVGRPEEVGVSSCVTTQAGGIHRFSRGRGGTEYLSLVAARLHMSFAGAMAALAGDAFPSMLQCQLGMRIRVEFFRLLSVASCAGFRACIGCWIALRACFERWIF